MNRILGNCTTAVLAAVALGAAALVAACGGSDGDSANAKPQAANDLVVQTLSSPPNFVTAGAALVQIGLPTGMTAGSATSVSVNGKPIDTTLVSGPRPNTLIGVVQGLPDGTSTVAVSTTDAQGGTHTGSLSVSNTTRTSGVLVPPVMPLICRTAELGLGAPVDADCNAPVSYSYLYRSTDPVKTALQPYDPAHPPSDVAQTATDAGVTVPFIVRNERGVIGRWVYDIAILFNPAKPWSATAPQAAWNHKVFWRFGGGCTPGHVQSANSAQAVDNSYNALGRGFAVATSGASVLGNHCDTNLSAEAVLTVKAHLAVSYGYIRYTFSDGSSGGSIQQHALANNYPGLLNGIIMSGTSFPDGLSIGGEFADCHLLRNYFNNTAVALWTDTAQQAAVMGKPDLSTCMSVDTNFFGLGAAFSSLVYDPTVGCLLPDNASPPTFSGTMPAPGIYDPVSNRQGVRCTFQDGLVAIFGKRADGFANRPFDSVGVQYGLAALRSGAITPAQFIDLNQRIGGLDVDGGYQSARSAADTDALPAAYLSGQVVDGKSLGNVPIIAWQSYNNQIFHDSFYNWQVRARLTAANGNADNQVIWTFQGNPGSFPQDAFSQMDQWLGKLEADTSSDSQSVKVMRARPAATVDACLIGGTRVTDAAMCSSTYPNFSDPRIVAGADLTNLALKCQLKPVDLADYAGKLSAADVDTVRALFPQGVCDYSKPGVGQQPVRTWSTWIVAA
ncbi:DUF6351 family protein [Cupriavidus basilensis]|uniref:DUF6351 family protein n=1 Tax=Cupriavidus basilensis TaxID=68895 RepID=UPI0020A6C5ED|nr:DUF6351 family protein [Cupriavidus basilensis]MCP3018849.1 DUF6351 family protein [Cupriavidus basilensis]